MAVAVAKSADPEIDALFDIFRNPAPYEWRHGIDRLMDRGARMNLMHSGGTSAPDRGSHVPAR